MTVYVDNEKIAWRGQIWCHLVADSLLELHTFAKKLGLKFSWFQDQASYPHYDVTISVRFRALEMGAIEADRAVLLACCKALKAELILSRKTYPSPSDISRYGPAPCLQQLF